MNKSIKPLTSAAFYQNKFDSYAFETQTSRWKIKAIKWFISSDGVFSISILISSVLHPREGGRGFFVRLSSGWATAKSITCVHLSLCPNLSLRLLLMLDFVISLQNRFCFLMLKKRVPLCHANPDASVLVARALPVYPCAGYFDKHDISCQLVHNIYIELSQLRQKSPITHSLPAVVHTTKALFMKLDWSSSGGNHHPLYDETLRGFQLFYNSNFCSFSSKGSVKGREYLSNCIVHQRSS